MKQFIFFLILGLNCWAGNTKVIAVASIDARAGLTEMESNSVLAHASSIMDKVTSGDTHAIWLLPKLIYHTDGDPFGKSATFAVSNSLGCLQKNDVKFFFDGLMTPEKLSAWDVGANWTWTPLMNSHASSDGISHQEFFFVSGQFCWRVRATQKNGSACWADLMYGVKFSEWVKEHMFELKK